MPRVVLPSLNVTVPEQVEDATVAVNLTDEPYEEGFADDERVVVELALFTVCVNAEEVLPLCCVSPVNRCN